MAHFVEIQNPFDRQFDRTTYGTEKTILEWLQNRFFGFDGFEEPTVCCINNEPVLQAEWGTRQLSDKDIVTIVPVVAGGGIVGSIISSVVATVAVTAAINVVLNVPKPKTPGNAQEADSVYGLQGQYNQRRLGQPIEVNFGTVRRWPAYAAATYNKYINNEQYFYALFCIGQGDHEAIDALIEDTQIGNFEEAEYDFIAPGEGLNLFENNVITSAEIGGIELYGPNEPEFTDWVGPFILNPANTTTNRVELDFVCPQGLYFANDDGGLDFRQVSLAVEFQRVDGDGNPVGDWLNPSAFLVTESRTRKVQAGYGDSPATSGRWGVTGASWGATDGQGSPGDIIDIFSNPELGIDTEWTRKLYFIGKVYGDRTTTPLRFTEEYILPENTRWQVRAKRTNNASDSHRVGDTLRWDSGRAFLPNVTDFGDVSLLAFQARASNNLNDNSQQRINAWVTRKLPTWDSVSGWSEPTATRSIVWAFCEIFRAKYGGGLADNMLNLEELATLDGFYNGRGEYFDYVFANKMTVLDAAKTVARAGRGVPMIVGTQLTIVRDGPATLPTSLFGPHNMIKGSFEWEVSLYDNNEPDAVEIAYTDPDTFQEETIICGLDDDPVEPVRPQRTVLSGVTNRDVAYREGLYIRANQRYVREQVKFKTGLEGRIPAYGAFIGVAHDLPQWGQSGRIKSIFGKVITAQNKLDWVEGADHQIAFRDRYGGTIGPYGVTRGDSDSELVLFSELPPSTIDSLVQDDNVGQPSLFLFGVTNQFYRQMKVTRIQNGGKDQVLVTAVNYSNIPHSFDGVVAPPKENTSSIIELPKAPVLGEITVDVLPNSLSEITVKWSPVLGANKYRIEQSFDGGNNYVLATEVVTNFASLSVTPGAIYLRASAVGQGQGPYVYWQGTVGVIPTAVIFDPPAGGYINGDYPLSVAISSETVGVEIRWSKTELPQNVTQGTEYTEAVSVSANETLYARAFIGSLLAGPGGVANYFIVPNLDFSNSANSGQIAAIT